MRTKKEVNTQIDLWQRNSKEATGAMIQMANKYHSHFLEITRIRGQNITFILTNWTTVLHSWNKPECGTMNSNQEK